MGWYSRLIEKSYVKIRGVSGRRNKKNGAWEEVGKYDLGRYIPCTRNKLVWLGKGKKSWSGTQFLFEKSVGEKRSPMGRVRVEK